MLILLLLVVGHQRLMLVQQLMLLVVLVLLPGWLCVAPAAAAAAAMAVADARLVLPSQLDGSLNGLCLQALCDCRLLDVQLRCQRADIFVMYSSDRTAVLPQP